MQFETLTEDNFILYAAKCYDNPNCHNINEFYDEGAIIFQEKVKLDKDDNLEDISYKVKKLEHKYFPTVIKDLLNGHFN